MALLEVQNISFQKDEQQILDQITLSVAEGDFLTLSGPSGGGKSTLLRLIASLITPTSGTIFFQDKKQSAYDYTEYRKRVSYCFQQPTLFGETVQENLEFPFLIREMQPDHEKIRTSLKRVDLPEHYVTKPITQLSGGERQRVALLRNLLFLPRILLLDEVTVGLDERTKEIIHQLIHDVQKQGCTLIQVTHDDSEMKTADKLLIVKEGRISQ